MIDILKARLAQALALTDSLAREATAETLAARNGGAKSNTIGGQFWCLVGARESYARAIEAGVWRGFACSLGDTESPQGVRAALAASNRAVVAALDAARDLDGARLEFLISLNEHEAQHHGQLIRYFYANDLAFPPEFAARYALD